MTAESLTRMPALFGVVAGAVTFTLLLAATGGDAWWADHLYAWQGGTWAARDAWWSAELLHVGGRRFSISCWMLAAVALGLTWSGHVPQAWRRPLGYVLVTVPLATLLVAVLKTRTGIDCPWDLQRYGGTHPWLSPFDARPAALGPAACFPAAHAAAGYAWVALYFACAAAGPSLRNLRHLGLAFGLALGLLFGIVQQLRGAHFLSHDLWALTLCWLIAALSARVWLPAQLRDSISTRTVPIHAAHGALR
ncbi:phosphatase PAP2 family protein [Luteimonas fraxinea]|uniref:Phosphatase PAP2 family protein n=1 Tax=Luteimonas fraxinea TaxID=2901869 RepID=A0ABS8U8U7_9GAMM|nr:phosphatase PAP2 family protein [Luteimonas fraxinea]MCD9095345.1 phosphatase PAP2 family protein [Luteimonas fraxinea]UHH11441.1 phosphatase PAP2 family protein [Luteimonas fraxinea]